MAKKHHCGRKDRPQRVCNPDACPNCMYVGEGDSWCDKIGEIILSDWEPTEYYMGCCKKGKEKSFHRRAERKRKMNLIREIFFSPMAVDAAGIILIVAALPMVGWSWAVSHMAGPKVKNAKEGT